MPTPEIPGTTDLRLVERAASTAVYMGRESGDGEQRQMAVKLFEGLNAAQQAKFERQWRVSSLLNGHRGIAEVYDGGLSAGGTPYVVRAGLDGPSLADEKSAASFDSPADVVSFMAKVADIVAYAHRNGVTHGALKPSNIFRSADGSPIITDFSVPGLTDHTSSGSAASGIDGEYAKTDPTAYLAPELLGGTAATPSADVFALGSVLYTLLAGRRAFKSSAGVRTATPKPLPGLPAELTDVVGLAMAKRPTDRPRSAALFAQSLRRVLPLVPNEPSERRASSPAAAPSEPTATPTGASSTEAPKRVDQPIRTVASRPRNPAGGGEPTAPRVERAGVPGASIPATPAPVATRSAEPFGNTDASTGTEPNLARWGLIGAAALVASLVAIFVAWNFLIDLTSADTVEREVQVASDENAIDPESTTIDTDATATADASAASDNTGLGTTGSDTAGSDTAASGATASSGITGSDDSSSGTNDGDAAAAAEPGDDPTAASDDSSDADSGDSSPAEPATADAALSPADDEASPLDAEGPRPTASPNPPATSEPAQAAATATPEPEPTTGALEPSGDRLTYTGPLFAADLPVGWAATSEHRDVGYGFRTRFDGPDNDFLYIDTTPPSRHDGTESIQESAFRIAEQVSSAGPVYKLTIAEKETWWFEYTGNDGSQRIDVFFAIGDTGYAVVGGSHDDPADAYRALIRFVESLEQA